MRKQLLTIFGVAVLGMASYAATFMQVKTNDGKIVKFDVEDVTEVDFMTEEIIPQDTTPVIPSDTSSSIHSYVDLGLPSGTLWATYNIGATKPEEYGDYLAWGETEPKEVYDRSTYKWGDDEMTKYKMTKYNDGDGLMTLLPEDDAATANWGSEWRMPTIEEQRELVEACQYQMTEVNGVYGAKFTGKNGNSVFFPAAGGRYGSDVGDKVNYGIYWSSSLVEKGEYHARYLGFGEKNGFGEEYVDWGVGDYRGLGFSVRAVRVQKAERKMYVVKFYTSDSVLINSQEVLEGASAKEIQAPEKNGYEFIGWSASLDKITSDMSVYALYKEKSPIDTSSSIHTYVDLGLPSGTLWATYNIGATKLEEYGDYFAWGETEPKEVYDWSTYKYAKASEAKDLDSLTKYNSNDGLTTLLPEDDAATANWGSDWRMPTNEEQRELLDECYVVWTDSYNGSEVRGIIVYKAKSAEDKGEFVGSWQTPSEDYSTSDAHVFFPAAGYRYGSGVSNVGYYGSYWSSSLLEKYENYARNLYFNEEGAYWSLSNYRRSYGFPVRAVRAQK